MRRLAVSALLTVLCCFALAPVAQAQSVLKRTRGERSTLAPGIEVTDYERTTNDGRLEAQLVRVDLARREATLEALLPSRGAWSAGRQAELAAAAPDTEAVLAWSLEPGLGDPPWPDGLLFAGGELLSWPPTGPVAAILPEGAIKLLDPGECHAAIVTHEGSRIPLASINGPPSMDAPALYSGAFSGQSIAGASWPEGTLAVPIEPAPGNEVPALSIWNENLVPSQRRWLAGTPIPLKQHSIARGGWALIVPLGMSPEHRRALMMARTFLFEVELPSAASLSVLALQGQSLLLRGGQLAGPEGEPAVRTALATDASGAWVLLAQAGTLGRRQVAVTRQELAAFLVEQGATEAIEVATDRRRLLADLNNDKWTRELGSLSARVALGAVSRAPALPGTRGESLRPIAIGSARGSNEGVARNGPMALIDGQAAWQRDLAHFWVAGPSSTHLAMSGASFRAARADTGDPANHWAELQFYAASRIRAVDLVHAEDCGFSPDFNIKSFRLLGRGESTRGWVELAVVRHEHPVARERLWISHPAEMEAIRLEVLEPNFLVQSPSVRLAEVVVWGE